MASDLCVAARTVWQLRDGEVQERAIEIVLEEPLALYLNGTQVAVLMRLPGLERELATGFCLSEGLVSKFDHILTIRYCGGGLPASDETSEEMAESRNRIEVCVRPEGLDRGARLEVVRLVRAGCGAIDIDRAELPLDPVAADWTVDWQVFQEMNQEMRGAQHLRQHAGGVHAAALFDQRGALVVLCEDVGRHNAVDKVIGYCRMRDIALDDKILLCSGRLSYEMVTKVIRLGIPILASVSAPTALAVQLAERFQVTVIGYLRGQQMTVYTHPQRVQLCGPMG